MDNLQTSQSRDGQPIIVGSHRRSGTHMLIDTIRMNFAPARARRAFGVNPHFWAYLNIDRLNPENKVPITPDGVDATLARATRPVIKSHNFPDMREVRPEHQAYARALVERCSRLYVVRDPRSTMCSYWVYRRGFDPSTADNIHDFIRQTERDGLTRTQAWTEHASAWIDFPGTLTLRFEDIIKQTATALDSIADHTAMQRDQRDRLLPARGAKRWQLWLGRVFGPVESTNIIGGEGERPPKWQQVLSREDCELIQLHCGPLMRKLGYTTDDDWYKSDQSQQASHPQPTPASAAS